MNKFAIRVQNTSTNIQKIPFKLNTPREIMEKIDGTINPRKKRTIPPDVSMYVDLERLKILSSPPREAIRYTIKEIKEIPVIIPKKKRGPKRGITAKKDDKKTDKKKNIVEKEAK